MAISCAMPLALTSRKWSGFLAIKPHLKLSMEDAMEACGPGFAPRHVPKGWLWGWQDCRRERMLRERNSAQ